MTDGEKAYQFEVEKYLPKDFQLTPLQRCAMEEMLEPATKYSTVGMPRCTGMTTAIILAVLELQLRDPHIQIAVVSNVQMNASMTEGQYNHFWLLIPTLAHQCPTCGQVRPKQVQFLTPYQLDRKGIRPNERVLMDNTPPYKSREKLQEVLRKAPGATFIRCYTMDIHQSLRPVADYPYHHKHDWKG